MNSVSIIFIVGCIVGFFGSFLIKDFKDDPIWKRVLWGLYLGIFLGVVWAISSIAY